MVILCFRQGRLAFRANTFGFSSVLVGREVKCEVLVIGKLTIVKLFLTSVPSVDQRRFFWTRFATGHFKTPPTIYHQAVRRDLCDPECPVKQSTMIQYVNDILIASNRS